MAIQVLEATAELEAVILRRCGVRLAARLGGLVHQAGHVVAAVRRKTQQHLGVGMRIHDRLAGELPPPVLRQQHDVDGLGENHASRGVVGESGVVDGANRLVEGLGAGQVCHAEERDLTASVLAASVIRVKFSFISMTPVL